MANTNTGMLLALSLPPWAVEYQLLGLSTAQWVGLIVFAGGAYILGAVVQGIVLGVGQSVAQRTRVEWDEKLLGILPGPLRYALALLFYELLNPLLGLAAGPQAAVDVVVRTLLIVTLTWAVMRLLTLCSEFLEHYLTQQTEDPNRIRSIQTQIAVPRGILRFVAVVVGLALICLQFEVVRSVGVSLIASAGLAGVMIGFAAQRTVANLLAGIQLAIFQPIKIGDVVIVENEWGWIEEIALTYVVIKVWDLRRLVIPVSYFLERPFQNWTKGPADLLGTVFLHTDYTVPVEEIRAELKRIVEESELWDKRAQGVQVTNLTDRSVEVRALVSAADGSKLWDLRCLVREKLLTWLQSRGKECLPVQRVEVDGLQQQQA
ncbi:MAG: mechanosensitive ion channel family protein [Gemmataceae bacterium]